MRLPWGVNEPRLTNYVLETMAKMYKMRNLERKEETLHSERSKNMLNKEPELTPERGGKDSLRRERKVRGARSPGCEEGEKTDKKSKSRRRVPSEQNETEKQPRRKQPVPLERSR
jgi:hypothetical protein